MPITPKDQAYAAIDKALGEFAELLGPQEGLQAIHDCYGSGAAACAHDWLTDNGWSYDQETDEWWRTAAGRLTDADITPERERVQEAA